MELNAKEVERILIACDIQDVLMVNHFNFRVYAFSMPQNFKNYIFLEFIIRKRKCEHESQPCCLMGIGGKSHSKM